MDQRSDATEILQPAIRFKGFTEAWELRKFKDTVYRIADSTNADYLELVEYENLESGGGAKVYSFPRNVLSKSGILFQSGDVLYGKLRPYLKKWFLAENSGVAVGDFWVFRSNALNMHFLYFLIQSDRFQDSVKNSIGTKMPRADWKSVSVQEIVIPQHSEQVNIGSFFAAVDATLTLQQRKS